MKNLFFISISLIIIMLGSCKNDPIEHIKMAVTPKKFRVKIPDAISSPDLQKNIAQYDTLQGEDIYKMLRVFINVGDESAQLVESIILNFLEQNISEPLTTTYVANDGRTKDLVVEKNKDYNGETWEYFLDVSDAGNKALQLFWNTSPVSGICILKPAEMNHNQNTQLNAMYQVYYTENVDNYDKLMEVSISGLDNTDEYYVKSLKMCAAQKGDIVDLFGNSCHPTAVLISTQGGIDWAFVAQSDAVKDIAMAEVCLPPMMLTTNSTMLTDYSIYNVYLNEMAAAGITDTLQQQYYLYNSLSPAYFGGSGFTSCGASLPSSEYSSLGLTGLKPYVPADIYNLNVTFATFK